MPLHSQLQVFVILVVFVSAPRPSVMALRILLAADTVPSPVVTFLAPAALFSLVPMVVVLLGALTVVMFRESGTVIATGLAVAVSAGAVVITVCQREPAGQSR